MTKEKINKLVIDFLQGKKSKAKCKICKKDILYIEDKYSICSECADHYE